MLSVLDKLVLYTIGATIVWISHSFSPIFLKYRKNFTRFFIADRSHNLGHISVKKN